MVQCLFYWIAQQRHYELTFRVTICPIKGVTRTGERDREREPSSMAFILVLNPKYLIRNLLSTDKIRLRSSHTIRTLFAQYTARESRKGFLVSVDMRIIDLQISEEFL